MSDKNAVVGNDRGKTDFNNSIFIGDHFLKIIQGEVYPYCPEKSSFNPDGGNQAGYQHLFSGSLAEPERFEKSRT